MRVWHVTIGCLIFVAVAITVTLISLHHRGPKAITQNASAPLDPPIAWDFARSVRCDSIGWTPHRPHDEHLSFQGRRNVRITVPDGRTMAAEVGLVEVWEKEGEVVGVILYSPLADAQKTHDLAAKELLDWSLPGAQALKGKNIILPSGNVAAEPIPLDAWLQKALALDPNRGAEQMTAWEGTATTSSAGVYVGVSIRDTLGEPKDRWTVVWTADWQSVRAEGRNR